MRKRYTESFKLAVINQVIVDGQPIRGTAKANGINPVTLSRWLKQYREQYSQDSTTQDDNEILKSRLEEVIFERDTLKATIAILLKEAPVKFN